MGTKQNPGKFDCYANAELDEPMFVLLARDPIAPATVYAWVNEYCRTHPQITDEQRKKCDEAIHCADQMVAWHKLNPKK